MSAFGANPKRVLVLGGGDGLAVREILKYPSVESITLVDLDPEMTSVSKHVPALGELNQYSFDNPKVSVVNADAFVWLDSTETEPFDAAIIDFPDPNNFALGKLYTTRFYNLLKQKLKPDSSVVIQTTSPLIARKSFWCIIKTSKPPDFPSNLIKQPCRVSAFGVTRWRKLQPFDPPTKLSENIELKFLNDQTLASMFEFSADTNLPQDEEIEINRLDNQALVRYYEAEWRRFE